MDVFAQGYGKMLIGDGNYKSFHASARGYVEVDLNISGTFLEVGKPTQAPKRAWDLLPHVLQGGDKKIFSYDSISMGMWTLAQG